MAARIGLRCYIMLSLAGLEYLDTLLLSTQCGFHIEDMSFTLISVCNSSDAGYWSSRPAVWQI